MKRMQVPLGSMNGYMLSVREIALQLWDQWKKSSFQFLLVTSSIRGEGKTFVSDQIADVLHPYFEKLLVLRYLNAAENEERTELWRQNLDEKEGSATNPVLSSHGISHACLFSGGIPEGDKSVSRCFERFRHEAGGQFDLILLDFPCLTEPGFPFAIFPNIDKIVLVVRADHTPKKRVLESLALLDGYQEKIAGLVFNRQKEYIPKIFLPKI